MISALQWRYATKVFDPSRTISLDDLAKLTDALLLSPSSYGLEPWRFIIVRDPAIRVRLREASYGQPQITDSSHVVVLCRLRTCSQTTIDKHIDRIVEVRQINPATLSGLSNVMTNSLIHGPRASSIVPWMGHQVYIALGILLATAATMEIDSCPMEGFDPARYDEILGLETQGLASVVVCPIGYRSPDDKYAHLPKVRFPKEDVIQYI